ncbi:TonB-dependent receptor plug domain-containing protein [Reichenbachiella ulvae]|uniref:TonB-dependent receptor plug domain-containing protein n=1 Tax=Reichenbachiella ulvae TaxID=2980104 RepID=A0ABT3D060_9BACT|nr:TonB-dependent receptor [Reichenbachiella ulvae]MCV9389335.1 TonB-dependent receptor plug domain-containing protein [Reichenbachiella ulvae]
MKYLNSILLSLALLCLIFTKANAQSDEEILDLSLEELMNMEITSVSKKAERLQDVASAIYVVTSEDISKSGATNLHEVLRNVPGYWGMQSSYSHVFSSVRNSTPVNTDPGTVLYLLDGTPIQDVMGSVFNFHNFDIPLDEIDRIEVIKGSGGTIYGANSATGVVNIFTKNPEKYDGINVKAEGAAPGYAAVSVRAGGKVTEDLAISAYAKYRYFSGWESLAGKYENGDDNPNVTASDFEEDYETSNYYSAGAKLNYNLTDRSKFSARIHFNAYNQNVYTSVYGTDYLISQDDISYLNEVNANRTVANIRFDHDFSESHSLFVRASTNIENDFYQVGGGMNISNSIFDLEIQDNFSLGEFNDLSIGANYRFVNFDIHNINSTDYINYVDPQANESLKGVFIQDKVKLLDGKLNFTLGVKAENYSLVNDKYYLSPMAKASFIASKHITLWGGFTQSYTTPGFNSTNVNLFLFQTPDQATWTGIFTNAVYQQVYENAIQGGADDATAQAQANGYVNSAQGQQDISGLVQTQSAPNIAAKNGSETVPTQFQTWEIGLKSNIGDKFQFNTSLYLNNIADGISESADAIEFDQVSITDDRITDYYLYGNYVKGQSVGSETILKFFPIAGLVMEASHAWNQTEWEYQENSDFDIATVTDDPTPDPAFIPEHIFRFKVDYSFGQGFNVVASLIQTSEFRTESSYIYDSERYASLIENVVFPGYDGATVAENSSRTIINLRVEKKFVEDKLSVYAFGNDISNTGMIADTDNIRNATLSQIGAMYGIGLNYRLK